MESPFTFEGKALSTIELQEGDLLIDGMAVLFDGLDREGDTWAVGAFRTACRAFLEGSAPLCFQHRTGSVIGKVLEAYEVPGVGVRIKARVDGCIKDDPTLSAIYHQIRKRTITGLSWGGFLKRLGNKIVSIDPVELSVTATPTDSRPAFTVVQGKALELALVRHELEGLEWLRDQMQAREDALEELRFDVGRAILGMSSR